ncbi:hypothetical protein BDA96_08G125600 [Sorghum bicolor]|uniref:NB-ARC domain-containing protein n=1 Tax=Sorghum bicolor TaxID=4558 RepID=A0A921QGA7_SORBI|nr:hypothetical protein BDA96_08G125600 [Sorghum bicolor]
MGATLHYSTWVNAPPASCATDPSGGAEPPCVIGAHAESPPNYQIEDLLKQVMAQLDDSYEHCVTDHNDLVGKIKGYLRNKRYLIILDAMRSRDCWPCFDGAFVKNKYRSKVIITARIEAQYDHTIKIDLLLQQESWKRFSIKAFSKLSNQTSILVICQGLPLAIVVTNNPELCCVSRVLKLSLNDLPRHLRNHLLCCTSVPYSLKIIKFTEVDNRGTETALEEVAEEYLRELAQRSLIRVHDLVREMTLTISRKERFAHICNHPEVTDAGNVANRVSVHSGVQGHVSIPWINTASSNFRLLRVFEEGTKVSDKAKKLHILLLRFAHVRDLPSEITLVRSQLTSLRYLSVSKWYMYGTSIGGNICGLKQLHTLRKVRASKDLAQNLGYLTQLRSLGITGILQSYSADLWTSIMNMTTLDPYKIGYPLSLLSQMVNLVYLNLHCANDGESLKFCSGWFPKLKQLYLGKLESLSTVEIMDGAMTNLAYLELCELCLPGEFVEILEGNGQRFVQHIANIKCVWCVRA